jgi:ketosteroid isomerase-like protein
MAAIAKEAGGWLVGTILAIGLLVPAVAQALSSDDRATIRAMIADQIEAFRRDDAALAYGYAAPGIKQLFQTPERFMAMVREQYRPVYRPRSVTFGEIVETPDAVLQKVFLTGPDGQNWVAAYVAERQADGSWRISGCTLVVDDTPNI